MGVFPGLGSGIGWMFASNHISFDTLSKSIFLGGLNYLRSSKLQFLTLAVSRLFSFLLLIWTLIIWNMKKFNRGFRSNHIPSESQQWPNPNTHHQWHRAEQPISQPIYGQPSEQIGVHNLGNAVAGQTYTYDGYGKFVATSFGTGEGSSPNTGRGIAV
jgi:hypothetical protein